MVLYLNFQNVCLGDRELVVQLSTNIIHNLEAVFNGLPPVANIFDLNGS